MAGANSDDIYNAPSNSVAVSMLSKNIRTGIVAKDFFSVSY